MKKEELQKEKKEIGRLTQKQETELHKQDKRKALCRVPAYRKQAFRRRNMRKMLQNSEYIQEERHLYGLFG